MKSVLDDEIEIERERNEMLHEKLCDYFAELCDLWDIEFIEVTEEGETIMRSVAEQVKEVSYKHLVLGPNINTNYN